MPTVTFSWLNDGNPYELPDKTPLAGKRQLNDLKKKNYKVIALVTQVRANYLKRAIVAAKKLLEHKGAKVAEESWTATIQGYFGDESPLIFAEAEFEESLTAWHQDLIVKQMGCSDDEEALKLLNDESKQINEDLEGTDIDFTEYFTGSQLLDLYWRLRKANVKEVQTPSGPQSLSLDNEDQEQDMTLLSELVDEDDLKQIYAIQTEADDLPPSKEDFKGVSAEEMRGKSGKKPTPSTPSKPDSPPSLELTTETEVK